MCLYLMIVNLSTEQEMEAAKMQVQQQEARRGLGGFRVRV